jgi:hypothetical protein
VVVVVVARTVVAIVIVGVVVLEVVIVGALGGASDGDPGAARNRGIVDAGGLNEDDGREAGRRESDLVADPGIASRGKIDGLADASNGGAGGIQADNGGGNLSDRAGGAGARQQQAADIGSDSAFIVEDDGAVANDPSRAATFQPGNLQVGIRADERRDENECIGERASREYCAQASDK